MEEIPFINNNPKLDLENEIIYIKVEIRNISNLCRPHEHTKSPVSAVSPRGQER